MTTAASSRISAGSCRTRISSTPWSTCWWHPPHFLYARLERENRIDNSDEAIRRGSNVDPKQLTLTELRDGCAELMHDLYAPAAYLRLDALYLQRGLRQSAARSRYLRRHPVRALAVNAELLIEALATIWQLMRRIPDAALRREYRHRLWQAFERRPEPAVLQVYALKCALRSCLHDGAADDGGRCRGRQSRHRASAEGAVRGRRAASGLRMMARRRGTAARLTLPC